MTIKINVKKNVINLIILKEINNSTKKCVVKKHVEKERTVNITENKICGTFPCYVDPNNNYECVEGCRFPKLYEHNDDHEQCVLDIHNTTSNIVCSKK
jgi:hypothetical protein